MGIGKGYGRLNVCFYVQLFVTCWLGCRCCCCWLEDLCTTIIAQSWLLRLFRLHVSDDINSWDWIRLILSVQLTSELNSIKGWYLILFPHNQLPWIDRWFSHSDMQLNAMSCHENIMFSHSGFFLILFISLSFDLYSLVILLIALRGRKTRMVRMAEIFTSSTSTQYSKTLRTKERKVRLESRIRMSNKRKMQQTKSIHVVFKNAVMQRNKRW